MPAPEPTRAWSPGQGVAALRRRLGQDFALEMAQPLGAEGALPFRQARLALDGVQLHTLGLPPCRLGLHCASGPCLALPLAGELTLRPERRGGRPLAADAGRSAVLVPEGAFRLRCEGWVEVVLIALSQSAVAAALEPLLGPPAPPQARPRLEARLGRGVEWHESDPLAGPLLALLHQALRLLESSARAPSDGLALPRGALQDCLLRPLALLLLLEDAPTARLRAAPCSPHHPHGRQERLEALEALVAHIAANLHRPLCLQDLSELSGCSPRTLQYAFEQRFGCGPMQWVRLQRLEAAGRALREAGGREPVRQIARRCGYTNLSSFSRDIQRHFGQPPSALRAGPDQYGSSPKSSS